MVGDMDAVPRTDNSFVNKQRFGEHLGYHLATGQKRPR
jgi:hypothetical protein